MEMVLPKFMGVYVCMFISLLSGRRHFPLNSPSFLLHAYSPLPLEGEFPLLALSFEWGCSTLFPSVLPATVKREAVNLQMLSSL